MSARSSNTSSRSRARRPMPVALRRHERTIAALLEKTYRPPTGVRPARTPDARRGSRADRIRVHRRRGSWAQTPTGDGLGDVGGLRRTDDADREKGTTWIKPTGGMFET